MASFQTPMAAIDDADAILLIGSNIRHEAPILGQRVRKAWRKGAQVAALNPVDWNFHFELADKLITAPQHMVTELAALAAAVAKLPVRRFLNFCKPQFRVLRPENRMTQWLKCCMVTALRC